MLAIPYALNILILAPVCLGMFSGAGPSGVFQGRVAASAGLELLVGSLWLAILAGSVIGLFFPREMAPLLALQVFYKTTWLATFAVPLILREGWAAPPWGVTACFIGIVLVWPLFIWRAYAPA